MPGPFEAWLLTSGVCILFSRVRTAFGAAQRISEYFDGLPLVAEMLDPGLKSFGRHAVAARQIRAGFGGMLSCSWRPCCSAN